MKLIAVPGTKHSFFIDDVLSVGVYVLEDEKQVVLIDSGIDDAKAKKFDEVLKASGLRPVAIINTHSHADHCGGNRYFQEQYPGLDVYATDYEAHYIEIPASEPQLFSCGAEAMCELRNKHLEAKPSHVTQRVPLTKETPEAKVSIGGVEFNLMLLPGHTPGMMGVMTPESILYVGDAFFGQDTVEKHGILFYSNIKDTLDTFLKLSEIPADGFVLYHGMYKSPTDAKDLLSAHQAKIISAARLVAGLITDGVESKEALIAQVNAHLNVRNSVVQYALTMTCVNAYLQYLQSLNLVAQMATVDSLRLLPTLGAALKVTGYELVKEWLKLPVKNVPENYRELVDDFMKRHQLDTQMKTSIKSVVIDNGTSELQIQFDKPLSNKTGVKALIAALEREIVQPKVLAEMLNTAEFSSSNSMKAGAAGAF